MSIDFSRRQVLKTLGGCAVGVAGVSSSAFIGNLISGTDSADAAIDSNKTSSQFTPDFNYQPIRYIGGNPGFWPNAQLIPVDFNGDKRIDILVFNPKDGGYAKWYSDGTIGPDFNYQPIRYIGGKPGFWTNAQLIPVDFNGDGKTDILVFNPKDGGYAKWYSDGTIGPDFNYQPIRYIGGKPGFWPNAQLIPLDFNGDKKTDILVFNPKDGGYAKWYSDGTIGPDFNYQPIRYIGGKPGFWTNVQLISVDFNKDGKIDILVFHPSDGGFAKWYGI